MKQKWWIAGLVLAVVVALFSPLASPHPDGLERVAEDHAFIDGAQDSPYEIVPDYVFPGIQSEAVATIVAGIVGVLIVFGLTYAVAALIKRRQPIGSLSEEQ